MTESQAQLGNEPAYPCEGGDMSGLHAAPGMTKREFFAAHAMTGLLAACANSGNLEDLKKKATSNDINLREQIAISSKKYADTLLAALAEGGAR